MNGVLVLIVLSSAILPISGEGKVIMQQSYKMMNNNNYKEKSSSVWVHLKIKQQHAYNIMNFPSGKAIAHWGLSWL